MTAVARGTIIRAVQSAAGDGIENMCMKTMNGCRERRNGWKAWFSKRFGGMARGTKHRLIVGYHTTIETLRIKTVGCQGCLIHHAMLGKLMFVV